MLINNKKYGIYILAKFIYIIAFIKKIKTTTWEKKVRNNALYIFNW